jgi:hypothetical protein
MASTAISDRGSGVPVIPPDFKTAPFVRDILSASIEAACPGGLYAEFGVYRGASLRRIRACLPRHIPLYGFDSFKGIPEAWGVFPPGTFATSVRPNLPNTHLVEGRFEDTVPKFVRDHPEHVSFIHIDCDVYSSTRAVLMGFADRIVPGTVILFDEIIGYAGYEAHEYRAFRKFIAETGKQFEAIARWDAYRAAVRSV